MGLGRRVSIGFMSIVGVLILSGMVSFYELNSLSRGTDMILDTNAQYALSSGSMINALSDHNRAFVQMVAFDDRKFDTLCLTSITRLDSALVVAKSESLVPDMVDSLMVVAQELRAISEEYISSPVHDPMYSVFREEFPILDSMPHSYNRQMYERYIPIHDKMLTTIDLYVKESDRAIAPDAEKLHNNAYRAVTPILISLSVMIVIVLMLYYFIMLYCVKPVVKINSALRDYLAYKVPFAPKVESRDELSELTERIELLIKQQKTNKEG